MSAVLWKANIDALTLLSCFLRGREFGHRVCIKEFAESLFSISLSLSSYKKTTHRSCEREVVFRCVQMTDSEHALFFCL